MHKLLAILEKIRPEHNFIESKDFILDGLLDSFDVITLVSDLEKIFGISIDGKDITPENFKNLEILEQLINHYLYANNLKPSKT